MSDSRSTHNGLNIRGAGIRMGYKRDSETRYDADDLDGDATLRLPRIADAPSNPVAGDMYTKDSDGKVYVYQDDGWTTVDGTAASSLEAAYAGGQIITVDDANLEFDLDDAGNDYHLQIDVTANGTIDDGLVFATSGGGSAVLTDAIDATDAGITNAINVGTNTIKGTTGNIDFSNFDVTGASGNTSIGGTLGVTGATTLSSTVAISGAVTGQGQLILDVDNAEALLIRENGDSADIITVDTTGDAGDTTLTVNPQNTTGTGVAITADAITTGNGLHVSADAATSGTVVLASATEATLDGGYYFRAYDETDSADVFTVAEDGATSIISNADGATGAVLRLQQDSASPATNDVVGEIEVYGDDAGGNVTELAKVEVKYTDTTVDSEDADMIFSVASGSSMTQLLQLDSDVNGIVVGKGSAAGYVVSKGDYNLVLETGNSTTGTITMTDGANGDIDITPNGTGIVSVTNDSGIAVGAGDDFTVTLSSDDVTLANTTQDKDIIVSVNDDGSQGEVFRVDGSASSVLVDTDKKIEFRDTGLYIQSSADGQLDIVADTTVALSGAVTMDSTLTVTTGLQAAAVDRTATDDGTGTGTIADGTSIVTVDADSDANHIITLPTPTPGNVVWLLTQDDSTGFELRTDTPGSVGINGGTGASAESAIAAAIVAVRCVCVSADYWLCTQFDADGDESKVEAAA